MKILKRGLVFGGLLSAAGLLLTIFGRARGTVSTPASAPVSVLPSATVVPSAIPARSEALRPDVGFALSWLTATLTLAACALFITSALYFRTYDHLATLDTGMFFALAGGVVLGAALLLGRPTLPLLHPARTRPTALIDWRRTALLVLPGMGALAFLTVINVTGLTEIDALWNVPADLQMALLVGGAALVTAGMGGFRWHALPRLRLNWAAWALIAITLLALIVRVWDLENALHIFMDEMHFVDALNSIRAGESIKLLHPFGGLTAFPWTFPYLQKLSTDVFGATLVGIRVPSVLLGTLSIPVLYLLACTLFERKTALLAAFLLALFPPHIHYSRLGMNNIGDSFFGLLALAMLARGLKHNRRLDYALAGGALGFTQYFYEGGRLLFPALIVAWLVVIVLVWRLRAHWRNWLMLALTAIIIATPYYYTQHVQGFSAAPRLADMGHSPQYITELLMAPGADWLTQYFQFNLRPALLHYFYTPDGSAFFYGGDTALVLPYFVPLLLLGFFWAIWRFHAVGALLILWPLLTALGNSLLQQPDWSARFVVAFPVLPLLIAVGLRYTWLLLTQSRNNQIQQSAPTVPSLSLHAAAVLLTLGVMGLAAAQIPYYFGPHLALNNEQIRPGLDFHDVMFRTRDLPAGTQVFIISEDEVWWPQIAGMIKFWNLDVQVNFWLPDEFLPLHLRTLRQEPDRNRAFFVRPGDSATLQLVREQFDLNFPELSPYNVPADKQYVLYFAPVKDAES